MHSAEVLAQRTGMSAACRTLSVPRSTLYRTRRQVQGIETPAVETPVVETSIVEMPVVETSGVETEVSEEPPSSPRALTAEERGAVRNVLNSERFQNSAPRQVYATLLDEGEYLCGWRTMYRILDEHAEVRERRNQLRHPIYVKPELLATGPNQLWSWDITKLRGPERWVYYYLYTMLDVFSRYAVGWMVAEQEAADLAKLLIGESCTKQAILPGQLVIHADRGSPMIAKSVALLMADLGVTKSHGRPQVSNDNPFSEAQFKTVKYHPEYPERFGSVCDARDWSQRFFTWYNNEHRHSSIALLTPADVHYGRSEAVLKQRQAVLQEAYIAHPERFVKGMPTVPSLPQAVWINPPQRGGQGQSTSITPSVPAETASA